MSEPKKPLVVECSKHGQRPCNCLKVVGKVVGGDAGDKPRQQRSRRRSYQQRVRGRVERLDVAYAKAAGARGAPSEELLSRAPESEDRARAARPQFDFSHISKPLHDPHDEQATLRARVVHEHLSTLYATTRATKQFIDAHDQMERLMKPSREVKQIIDAFDEVAQLMKPSREVKQFIDAYDEVARLTGPLREVKRLNEEMARMMGPLREVKRFIDARNEFARMMGPSTPALDEVMRLSDRVGATWRQKP